MAANFLKANPALYPLAAVIAGGCTLSGLYLARMAYNDATWSRSQARPWERISQTHNIKFLNVQSKDPRQVFKPQSSEDLRGKL